ncbi:MAG TPA: cytochrome c-type biogenesis protein CcmH [Gammaproteobacteria bacterium]|nr:cytochrome c-type biogenesis protein CcmH [Gammaproteobacteria bacterium]
MKYMSCLVFALLLTPVLAKEATPVMGDAVLQERVMTLSKELRCLVCQGQSLADSHSDFAIDMRNKIMDLMKQGMSDGEVKDYLVARYGDFILYRTPFKATTFWLYLAPFALLITGGAALWLSLRKRRRQAGETEPATISARDEERVKRLLQGGDTGEGQA